MPVQVLKDGSLSSHPHPDDIPFKPYNKIRGSDFESVVVELLVAERSSTYIQNYMQEKCQFKVSYKTVEIYRDTFFSPAVNETEGNLAMQIKKSEKALDITQELKERSFTDMLSRVEQLRQDIRILDVMINKINHCLEKPIVNVDHTEDEEGRELIDDELRVLLGDPRQQMTMKSLIESRDKSRQELNLELNNPNSFMAQKLEIMKQVGTKAILRFAPWVCYDPAVAALPASRAKAKALVEDFKNEIKYL